MIPTGAALRFAFAAERTPKTPTIRTGLASACVLTDPT
jgi:hypothetical protein